ncbi:4-O-dimethylallyl-L-tyrosine synthase [Physcia stellaris]|nr:4-O-dimethylallyl-L-tyrosine synthase [Physcia stellaris]
MSTLWKWVNPCPEIVAAISSFLHGWTPHRLPWHRYASGIGSRGREGSEETDTLTQAWQVVAEVKPRPNDHVTSWWQATGPSLLHMLEEAKYDSHSQQKHLTFYSKHLVHRLGPWPLGQEQPSRWRSFVTDDFSPLEYSWSWNKGSLDAPKVRYTIELVGPEAGSVQDSFNITAAVDTAREIACNSPNVDLTWFNHFLSAFVDPSLPLTLLQADSLVATASPSSVFLAFDLNHNGTIAMKAYLIPLKAEQTGTSRLGVVSDTIAALPSPFPSFSILEEFLLTHTLGLSTSIVGVGVDCVHPSKARLRLYVRFSITCFDKVIDMLTLGGTLPTLKSAKALGKFRKLWYQLLSLPSDFPTSSDLPSTNHETGGILYSFDVKPGNVLPEAKIYVPVKHYAENDSKAFYGLKSFLEEEGKSQWIDAFQEVLQSVSSRRRRTGVDGREGNAIGSMEWEKQRGMQTYVGVGFEGDDLALTSYIAPQLFGGPY